MIRSGDEARDNEAGKTTDDQKKRCVEMGPGRLEKESMSQAVIFLPEETAWDLC